MPRRRSRQEVCKVSNNRSRECCERYRDVGIDSEAFGTLHLNNLSDNRRDCRINRRVEVTTKQRAKGAATRACR